MQQPISPPHFKHSDYFLSYNLRYNVKVKFRSKWRHIPGRGRGFIDQNTMLGGAGEVFWKREGSKAYLEEVVNISDGTQNLHRGVMDMMEKTLVLDAYILR